MLTSVDVCSLRDTFASRSSFSSSVTRAFIFSTSSPPPIIKALAGEVAEFATSLAGDPPPEPNERGRRTFFSVESAYVSARQHTSVYVCIREHT